MHVVGPVQVVSPPTDWWANVFSGVAGGVIGVVGTLAVAVLGYWLSTRATRAKHRRAHAERVLRYVLEAQDIHASADTNNLAPVLRELRLKLSTIYGLMGGGHYKTRPAVLRCIGDLQKRVRDDRTAISDQNTAFADADVVVMLVQEELNSIFTEQAHPWVVEQVERYLRTPRDNESD